ncbi:MAG: hypothetical protein ACOYMS_02855 [Terrimicrobiaceae bacterium]
MTDFFVSHSIDPFLAGLVIGIIVCALARVGVTKIRSESSSTVNALPSDPMSANSGLVTKSVNISVSTNELGAEVTSAIMTALERGEKIEAIQILRAATGLDLKRAKDVVEAIAKSGK